MVGVKVESPWCRFNKKVKALFAGDPDIEVGDIYRAQSDDGSHLVFDLLVRNHEKFIALDKVAPASVEFGNVTLDISVQDVANDLDDDHLAKLFAIIFDGNPLVKDVKEVCDVTGTTHGYVRFKPEVIQFFDDDLSDYNGNWSGLAQDIAKELFYLSPGIHFCTAPASK